MRLDCLCHSLSQHIYKAALTSQRRTRHSVAPALSAEPTCPPWTHQDDLNILGAWTQLSHIQQSLQICRVALCVTRSKRGQRTTAAPMSLPPPRTQSHDGHTQGISKPCHLPPPSTPLPPSSLQLGNKRDCSYTTAGLLGHQVVR